MAPEATSGVEEFLDHLDHPIVFSFLVAVVVACWLAVFTWAFKAMNLPGPAALMQHP